MKLEKWCVLLRTSPALQPPERERFCLHGSVFGHPRCADGKEVTTSLVISRNGDKVVTKSGSEYELGDVDPFYEFLYPHARDRLLSGLRPKEASTLTAYEI
jgi:hypothetical protein